MTNEAAWNVTVHSDTRMNRMTNIPNTGTVLAGLDKSKHGIFICTADGGGLLKDHVYCCNADGNGLIDISSVAAHNHTSNLDGGEINGLFRLNPKHFDLSLTKTTDLQKANWIQDFTGSGTIEDTPDGTTGERQIRLRPNATSGSSATITYPHLKLDFSETSFFQAKLRIENTTNIAFHSGVGADDIASADSNTRKYQAEVCTVNNNNWWIRTANGSGNAASDSGVAITANRTGIMLKCFAGDTANLIIGGTELEVTAYIPFDGATTDIRLIKHSVKTSTTSDRPLVVYGSRVCYSVSDAWG